MPFPLGAVIAGGAALGQGALNWFTAKRNTDRTIKGNMQLAEYAYQKDLEQFERMKEYNSPTAQMQRFKDAGLNPHLIYGQGSPGNVSSTPGYSAPRVDYKYAAPNVAGVISQYQDIAMKDAQIDNVHALTTNVEARTASELVNKRLLGAKSEVATQYGLDLAQAELEQRKQSLTNAQKDEIGKDLRNQFQTYANQWAKYGVTGKDALIIRSGIKIMQQLGIDHSWLLDMLPKGTTLDDILKMQ